MMKKEQSIRRKLQGDNCFNPFNKAFDVEVVREYITQLDEENNDIYEKSIAEAAEIYNLYYQKYVQAIIEIVKKERICVEEIIETVFGMANYDYIELSRQAYKKGKNGSLFDFAHLEIFNEAMPASNINIVGAVEGQVDYLNTLLNVVRHISCENSIKKSYNSEQVIHSLYAIANVLYYIKESYDVALWENGYIQKELDGFHVKYIDREYPLAKHIGYIRTENNMAGTIDIVKDLSRWDEFRKVYFLTRRSDFVIDNVGIDEQGYIQYNLVKRENNFNDDISYVLARTEVDLYYPYIYQEKIEMLNDLSVNDMIILFSQLSKLMQNIEMSLTDKINVRSVVPVKIKKRDIIRFLKQMTTYSKKQIEVFLEINTNSLDSNNRVNLREKPLMMLKEEYICLLSAIAAPNYSYLTDIWLDSAKVDMKKRGVSFEKHIKNTLEELLTKRGYTHYIARANKFFNAQGDYEEIDLVLNLKSVVVLAEVKCIKYAMECRDTYNNMKIVRKASEQIKRKADYIIKYKSELEEEIGCIEGKEIIKVIITNYPIFAGTKVEGIPVIDFFVFDSYFRSGKLTHAVLEADCRREIEIPYYEGEDEMCNKMQKFIDSPPSIEAIRKRLGMEERQLTFPKADIQIFQEFPFVLEKKDLFEKY